MPLFSQVNEVEFNIMVLLVRVIVTSYFILEQPQLIQQKIYSLSETDLWLGQKWRKESKDSNDMIWYSLEWLTSFKRFRVNIITGRRAENDSRFYPENCDSGAVGKAQVWIEQLINSKWKKDHQSRRQEQPSKKRRSKKFSNHRSKTSQKLSSAMTLSNLQQVTYPIKLSLLEFLKTKILVIPFSIRW